LSYDAENRLVIVSKDQSTVASFVYDGDGRRVKSVLTTDAGVSTTYFVGNYYEVTDGVVTKYYYAGTQRIAMRKNNTLYFMLGDHLGSTSLVASASGLVVSQTMYKAWGEVRHQSGTQQTNYTYTGQYSYTADFGLMYYNARWYDSSLGRFAQADTIVPAGVQGYDRYAFVNNNPLKYIDPSGHMALKNDNGDYTKADEEYYRQRLDALRCQAGNDNYCSYGELHPIETTMFAIIGLAIASGSMIAASTIEVTVATLQTALINATINAAGQCVFTLIGGGACSVDEALQTAAFSVLMGGVSESISINPSYSLSTTSGYFKNMAAQSIAQVGFNSIFRGLAGKPTTVGNIMADAISGVYSTQFQSLAIPKTYYGYKLSPGMSNATASHYAEGASALFQGVFELPQSDFSIVLIPAP